MEDSGTQRQRERRRQRRREDLLALELLSQSAAHGGDERCSFPAAVLRLQEAHLAAGSQVQHRLSQDPRETRGREEERKRGREEEGERERERERGRYLG